MWPIELQAFSSAICPTFVQYFTRFQLTARLRGRGQSRGPPETAGLLVFISEVAEEGLSQENTACVWVCGYDAVLSKSFNLLY